MHAQARSHFELSIYCKVIQTEGNISPTLSICASRFPCRIRQPVIDLRKSLSITRGSKVRTIELFFVCYQFLWWFRELAVQNLRWCILRQARKSALFSFVCSFMLFRYSIPLPTYKVHRHQCQLLEHNGFWRYSRHQ